jgi:transaldolase
VEILPGVPEALERLTIAGFSVAIATNQPAAAKGEMTFETLEAIHQKIVSIAESAGGRITSSHICRHQAADDCACRKPRPGLIAAALAATPGASAGASWMVGDRATDVLAGSALGLKTALLATPPFAGDEALLAQAGCAPRFRGSDLGHFVDELLRDPVNTLASIKLFLDGTDLASLLELAHDPRIAGFTTNPTLMRKSGISDYAVFAGQVLEQIKDRPVSFGVFADDFPQMERQARLIASWAPNVYVKIPVTDTQGHSSIPLIRELSLSAGVQVNVTAICTLAQVRAVSDALAGGAPAVISMFAGRIADTGRDPVPYLREARASIDASGARAELLWASPREPLNVVQARQARAHIITVPPAMLKKLDLFGKDLADYSLETVKMFHDDATAAGYTL